MARLCLEAFQDRSSWGFFQTAARLLLPVALGYAGVLGYPHVVARLEARYCTGDIRGSRDLRKQVLLLQARNADMEKTNQQLMRRLSSAVDISLAEGAEPARPHAMSALDQKSETEVQYSLLTADATLEAKYNASSPRYAAQPRKASIKPRRRSLPGSPIKISIPSTPEVLLSWMPGRGHCQSQPMSSPMQLSLTPLTPRSQKSGCRSIHELLMARSHKTLEQNQTADCENHTLPANTRKGLGE